MGPVPSLAFTSVYSLKKIGVGMSARGMLLFLGQEGQPVRLTGSEDPTGTSGPLLAWLWTGSSTGRATLLAWVPDREYGRCVVRVHVPDRCWSRL